MNNPNFIASIAYTFETESRRNQNYSNASAGGPVYANPPAWAGFSLRKLWSKVGSGGKTASNTSGDSQALEEAPLNA